LNFFLLKWILKEAFHIAVPTPRLRRKHHSDSNDGSGALGDDLSAVGE
jgi:hypothetical protein